MAWIWVWVDLDGPLDVKVSSVLYTVLEARNLAWDPTTREGRQVREQMAATRSCTVPLVLCTALLLVGLASSTATPCSIPAAAPALAGGSAGAGAGALSAPCGAPALAGAPIRSATRGRAWWTLDAGRAGPGPEEFDRDLVALERACDAGPAASGPALPWMRRAGPPAAEAAWDFSPALEGSTQSDRGGGGVCWGVSQRRFSGCGAPAPGRRRTASARGCCRRRRRARRRSCSARSGRWTRTSTWTARCRARRRRRLRARCPREARPTRWCRRTRCSPPTSQRASRATASPRSSRPSRRRAPAPREPSHTEMVFA